MAMSATEWSIEMQCGDIILFNRPCFKMDALSAAICVGAKSLTMQNYDHVGIVVENPGSGELHLLEANIGGVTNHPLRERLLRTKATDIAIRKLLGPLSLQQKKAIWELANKRATAKYNSSIVQMGAALVSSYTNPMRKSAQSIDDVSMALDPIFPDTSNSFIKSLAHIRANQSNNGKLQENEIANSSYASSVPSFDDSNLLRPKAKTKSDGKRFFCSQLVAEVYHRVGVIAPTRHFSKYIPADFSSTTNV